MPFERKVFAAEDRVKDDGVAVYTIAQLSRKLATNPYKMKTSFKQLFGVSIGKYKKAAFIEYARVLLLDTDHTIDEIAMLLGYNSQQSFTTAFRNHWGCTPGFIKKSHRRHSSI
jgi:AraC-like DNA-binding protein